ncbi:MAG: hypothetical protein LUE21_05025 [Oscillospiraceae bacterium]|nr:hypothetical protein [Oscillospiraceae bacterium]
MTEPTCTEGGYTTYTCTVCSDSYVADETAATGHTYGTPTFTWAEDNESCTVSLTCTVCGTETTGTCTVTKDVTNADCTTGGQVVYTATVTIDGQEYTSTKTVTIAATGHTTEIQNAKAATCTEDGYSGDEVCTVCGTIVTTGETIPATGHTAGEAVVENEVAATCTEDGSYDSVTYCTVCGEELSRETVTVPATGHSYENGVCTVCGEKETTSGGSFWQNIVDWLKNLFGRWN